MNVLGTAKISDLLTQLTLGIGPRAGGFQFVKSGVNFITSAAITSDGFLDSRRFAAISRTAYETIPRAQVAHDDVLVCLVTTGTGTLKATIAASPYLPAAAASTVGILSIRRERILPKFLACTLSGRSLGLTPWRSAKPHLSLAEIQNIQIVIPPIAQQQKFCELIEICEAKILHCRQQLRTIKDELSREFDSLVSTMLPEALVPTVASESKTLPHGWRWTTFGELMDKINDLVIGDEFSQLSSIILDDIESDSAIVIPMRRRTKSDGTKLRFNAGDVLVGPKNRKALKVALAAQEGLAPQGFIVLRPRNALLGAFALVLFRSAAFAHFRMRHAAIVGNWSSLKKRHLALPPDSEMKRFGAEATAQLRLSGEIALSYSHCIRERQAMLDKLKQWK